MKNFQQLSIMDYRIKYRSFLIGIIAALMIIIYAAAAFGQTVEGNAVTWFDGDTITVRQNSGKYLRVRLSGIDSPETRQTHGIECKALIKSVTERRKLELDILGKDIYKRSLARIYVRSNSTEEPDIGDLSLFMIQHGCGWEYGSALDVKDDYQDAEQIARAAHVGLWFESNPMPPVQFRTGGTCP